MRWKTTHVSTLYDAAVQNRTVAPLAARTLWGYDINHLWQSIALLDDLPPNARVLDIPCGGGIALQNHPHHVAADISPTMLARARRPNTTFIQADITALPFATGAFDLCVSYNGLHCLPDPPSAIGELSRVLRPGGTLRGTTVIKGAGLRQDLLAATLRHLNLFGPSITPRALHTWLSSAGLTDIHLTRSGAVTSFTAHKPSY